jgi:hypothetical protein
LNAWQIDPTIAYLCAAERVETPLARAYPVEEWFPFSLKEIQRRLRAKGVGAIVVKKRGSPLDPRRWSATHLAGPERRVVADARCRPAGGVLTSWPHCPHPDETLAPYPRMGTIAPVLQAEHGNSAGRSFALRGE